MRRFINGLNPNDTFTIIDFSNTTQQLSAAPLPNTPQNRALAINYIEQLQANGGTYLLSGIQAVLKFPTAPAGRLRSIVLLTDGYIGNENEILAEVQRELKPGNGLYSFGVGSSVNRFLLNRIAEIGRGTSRIVRQDEPTEEVTEKFFRQINNPVLTNIEISWEGTGEAPIIYPSVVPDLFAEQPLVVFGRKCDSEALLRSADRTDGNLSITGNTASGKQYQKTFNINFEETGNPAIAQLWGRARIKDLMKEMVGVETKAGVEAVTDTALTYQLLSQYTAFVAVSDDVRVNPEDASLSMQVPVEMPEGVSYQGTIGSMPTSVRSSMRQRRTTNSNSHDLESFLAPPSRSSAPSRSGYAEQLDIFDITLIDPSLVEETDETVLYSLMPEPSAAPAPKSPAPAKGILGKAKDAVRKMLPQNQSAFSIESASRSPLQIQLVSVIGLDAMATAALTQYLQQLNLPVGFSGEIVFEFSVQKGRVKRIVLDEKASTLQEVEVIEQIKRSLLSWQVPESATGTVRLTLHIQS
jgi:Ca-activated chloride channel family protein